MNLQFKKYNKNYLKSCYMLMLDTWTFDNNLKNLKKRETFYKFLFQYFEKSSNYNEILIDEDGTVVGYIFATMKNKKRYKKFFTLYVKWFLDVMLGKYGKRSVAFDFYKKLNKLHDEVMEDIEEFDSEINLFFVSSKIRGQGAGKKLLNNFFEVCKLNNIKNTSLQTDTDCNYKYYDYMGFKLHKQVYSDIYKKGNLQHNVFCYTKDIK